VSPSVVRCLSQKRQSLAPAQPPALQGRCVLARKHGRAQMAETYGTCVIYYPPTTDHPLPGRHIPCRSEPAVDAL
jgi:hypothetical protein